MPSACAGDLSREALARSVAYPRFFHYTPLFFWVKPKVKSRPTVVAGSLAFFEGNLMRRLVLVIFLCLTGLLLAGAATNEPATLATALFLGCGIAAYALGLVLFRWLLSSGPLRVHLTIAVLALPTALIGIAITPLAQVAALAVILIAGATADATLTKRRTLLA